jgi:hypothetical protein
MNIHQKSIHCTTLAHKRKANDKFSKRDVENEKNHYTKI